MSGARRIRRKPTGAERRAAAAAGATDVFTLEDGRVVVVVPDLDGTSMLAGSGTVLIEDQGSRAANLALAESSPRRASKNRRATS